jgi:hypothetical protein
MLIYCSSVLPNFLEKIFFFSSFPCKTKLNHIFPSIKMKEIGNKLFLKRSLRKARA